MHKNSLKDSYYINSHTHHKTSIEDEVSVYVMSEEDILNKEVRSNFSCAGIHPWWPETIDESKINELKEAVESLVRVSQVWGVGETGLDRLYPEYFELQKDLFNWHIDLSEKYHKPLIIHNVRSGSDILEILKAKKPQSPWLFHDYRGNLELVHSLLKLHPHCYFSFGISLDNSQTVREVIREIPRDHILFETDAQKHLDIHDVYIRGCKELDMELDELKKLIYKNFLGFSPSLH